MSAQTEKFPKAKRCSGKWAYAICAAVLVAATVLLWRYIRAPDLEKEVKEGPATQLVGEGLSQQLQKGADASMFRIILSTRPTFDAQTGTGTVMIQNDNGNHADMQVEFVLDATGERVYQSAVLSPGDEEMYGKLSAQLAPGTYSATAYIHALSLDGGGTIGTMESGISLSVTGAQSVSAQTPAGKEAGNLK